MRDYRAVADEVATSILSGALASGARLPPQRRFAYDRGLAVSTASRVYAELARRGLVTGEVGRGTYVRALSERQTVRTNEPADAPIDLQLSISVLPEQLPLMAQGLGAMTKAAGLAAALGSFGPEGPPGAGRIIADFLRRGDWAPEPGSILLAGNGRQAVAAALAAFGRPGDRIGVEPLTYPIVKSIAQRLGLHLVPLRIDAGGIDLDALRELHQAQPLAAIYVQPTLQNPLGWTMDAKRRAALAALLQGTGLICIEDAVYAFLKQTRPLAAFAPDHVVYLDSLSKRFAPGTGLGFLVAPGGLKARLAAALRSGAWVASCLPAQLGLNWMADGTVARVEDIRRADARTRQAIAREALRGCAILGDHQAYFLWLELPEAWRADTFALAAAQRGVAITPASAFAVMPGHAPGAVRIAISAPAIPDLRRGLGVIRELLGSDSHDLAVE